MSKTKKVYKSINRAAIAAKIDTLIENGRKEITTKEELEKFPIGSLISYMNKNNIYKLGGFIIKFADEYFIYITPDFTTKYRVRYRNILKIWVGDVYSVTNDVVSLVKTKQKKTKFPVKIDNIVVYYAARLFDFKRFMNTERYRIMNNWFNYFVSNK